MKIGIVGLPNVGKSTLFNALTKSYSADAQNFPFTTIEPNVGIVEVKDERLTTLAQMNQSEKVLFATTQFVDIAGLVKGASEGEGLGNKFLSHIREVDIIVQVLRHFKDDNIGHVDGSVDPLRDRETINTELILADLDQVEHNLPALQKKAKGKSDKALNDALSALTKALQALQRGELIHTLSGELSEDEKNALKPYNLLTDKKFLYALNIGQDDLADAQTIKQDFENKLQAPVAVVCAALESEIMEFADEEREEYLAMLVEKEHFHRIPTLDDLISLAYHELGLMYYFTVGPKEARARTIPIGSTAPEAAGAIHTDFEKGFIKAEVVNYESFVTFGGRSGAKEHGRMKLEGKDYVVQDGDIIIFKFNT